VVNEVCIFEYRWGHRMVVVVYIHLSYVAASVGTIMRCECAAAQQYDCTPCSGGMIWCAAIA
jgi:hypothetical protein